jgi:hypothetical protein
MSSDKSAKQRSELTQKIAAVEGREDAFAELRNAYRQSLERFHQQFHAVTRRREASLHGQAAAGRADTREALNAQSELVTRVDRYVEETAEELDQASSRIRSALDTERERLIAERNTLPWE